MNQPSASLQQSLQRFMKEVPFEVASSLCDRLGAVRPVDLQGLKTVDLGPMPYPRAAEIFCDTVRACAGAGLAPDVGSLSRWMISLAATAEREAAGGAVELVWTGPVPEGSMFRRTDQALQEVICAAKRKLLIVSFAVFKVGHIAKAVKEAVARGVEVTIVLEDQKLTGTVSTMMGEFGDQHGIRFMVWPESERPKTPTGQHGAMHVKCAVADDDLLFISSANLTEFALNLNMELGLLVKCGDMPKAVVRHFGLLASEGLLATID